jgi:hypothetical protein
MLHLSFHGGCSSGVERLTVAQEVAGSRPVTHPIFPNEFSSHEADGASPLLRGHTGVTRTRRLIVTAISGNRRGAVESHVSTNPSLIAVVLHALAIVRAASRPFTSSERIRFSRG